MDRVGGKSENRMSKMPNRYGGSGRQSAGRPTRKLLGRVLFYFLVIGLCAAIAFPVYWMVTVAFQPFGFSRSPSPQILPEAVTFDSFRRIFGQRPLARWLTNSAFVALVTTTISISVSVMAAYALSRYAFRGAKLLGVSVLVTQMLPPTMLVIPLYQLFAYVGILNTRPAIILAHMSAVIPLCVWMLKGFFDGIPRDLELAAEVDGCTQFGAFWRIALPLTLPGLAATSLYAFVVSWNEYLYARTLATPQELWTASVGLASFRGEYFTQFEPMMASSLIFTIPVLIVFVVLQRHLVSGLTAGGVKG